MNYEKPNITSTASMLVDVQSVQLIKGPYFPDTFVPNDPRPTAGAYEADE